MVHNATLNNISVISWRSVLLLEKTGRKPQTCRKSLTTLPHIVVLNTSCHEKIIVGTYSYLCNQCISPLMLWVWIPIRQGVLDTTLCDKVCQWLVAGTLVSSTNKTDCHDITEILFERGVKHHKPTKYKSFRTTSSEEFRSQRITILKLHENVPQLLQKS